MCVGMGTGVSCGSKGDSARDEESRNKCRKDTVPAKVMKGRRERKSVKFQWGLDAPLLKEFMLQEENR